MGCLLERQLSYFLGDEVAQMALVEVWQLEQVALLVLVPQRLHDHGREAHDALERLQAWRMNAARRIVRVARVGDVADDVDHLVDEERTLLDNQVAVLVERVGGQLDARQVSVEESARLQAVRVGERRLLDLILQLGQIFN